MIASLTAFVSFQPTSTNTNQSAPASTNSFKTTTQPSIDVSFLAFIKALEIKPGSLLIWGITLTTLGLIASAYSREGTEKFEKKLRKRRSLKEELREKEELLQVRTPQTLVQEASRWLGEIKFQQSFSSGWSGSLKLPVAFESSVNNTVNLAQKQLSLPEIIDAYRNFLKLVSENYTTIVGIDELDKLESNEKAQHFINEIKSLFGQEYCFYLVSVSDHAMSNFERRGIAFRDVFDSAFDTIMYVDYLEFQGAKDLLDQRVLGLPVPFLCLLHCISGGLPRDLIRACRNLQECRQKHGKTSLSMLCNQILATDIATKLKAIYIAAKEVIQEPEFSKLLRMLEPLESAVKVQMSSKDLLAACEALFTHIADTQVQENQLQNVHSTILPTEKNSNVIAEVSANLESLRMELVAYLYYNATLIELFAQNPDVDNIETLRDSGRLDGLVKATHLFAISPLIACFKISEFRESQGLQVLRL